MDCTIPPSRFRMYMDAERHVSTMGLAREASEHLAATLAFQRRSRPELAAGATRAAMVATLRLATTLAVTPTAFLHKARCLSLLLDDMHPPRPGRIILVAEAALALEVRLRASNGLLPDWWVASLPPVIELWRHVDQVASTRPAPRIHECDVARTERYREAARMGSGSLAVMELASTIMRDMVDLARNGTPLRGTDVVLMDLALQLCCDVAVSAEDAARTGRLFELLVPGKRRAPLLAAGMRAWCCEEAGRWGWPVAGSA